MTTVIPIRPLFIQEDGYHLLIKAKVNGRSALLLIDTGASKTVFDKKRMMSRMDEKDFSLLDRLSTGLGTTNMETHGTTIKKLSLGKLTIPNFETILLDLSHVNTSYESLRLPAIDGVLGSDIMMEFQAVIDYRNMELKLRWTKNYFR